MNTLLALTVLLMGTGPEIIMAHSGHEKKNIKTSRGSAAYISPVSAGGHGTGTYVKIKDKFFIVTAKHVTDKHTDFFVDIGKWSGIAVKVFESKTKDISVLQVAEVKSAIAIEIKKACVLKIGETVYFSGFPSQYSLMTTKAFISGENAYTKYMQGFAWFGSSGSGIINEKNKLCGVLTAIAIERKGFFTHALETLNYVHMIEGEDIRNIIKAVDDLRKEPVYIK